MSEVDSVERRCPECGNATISVDYETVCSVCGLVLKESQIDHGKEWRGDDEEHGRTGPPRTERRHDHGDGTVIGQQYDGVGKTLSGSKQRRLARQRKHNKSAQFDSLKEQNLADGLSNVKRIVTALGFNQDPVDQACRLYRTAHGEGIAVGRSLEALAAATVYATCRLNSLSRTLEEVAQYSSVELEKIWKTYTAMQRELELPIPPRCPTDHIPRIVQAVELSSETRRQAERLAKQVEDVPKIQNRTPAAVAAALVSIVSADLGERPSKTEVANAASISLDGLADVEADVRPYWSSICVKSEN